MRFTEFGEYFRILRIKHHEVLRDAAGFLKVSCAFISSVECGHKTIPDNWYEEIVKHYHLNDMQQKELKEAIDRSAKSIKFNIENSTPTQKDLAIQFQRSFDELDEKTANEILDILKRNA